jgi:hypothetical protein
MGGYGNNGYGRNVAVNDNSPCSTYQPFVASAEDSLQDKVNDILYYFWDPIGMKSTCCLSRDEYQHYVPSILRLMKESANAEQISQLLQKTAKEHTGIDTNPESHHVGSHEAASGDDWTLVEQ